MNEYNLIGDDCEILGSLVFDTHSTLLIACAARLPSPNVFNDANSFYWDRNFGRACLFLDKNYARESGVQYWIFGGEFITKKILEQFPEFVPYDIL